MLKTPYSKMNNNEKLYAISKSGRVLANINGEKVPLDVKSINPGGKINVKGEIPPNWGDEQRFTITVDDVIEANVPDSYFESINDKFILFTEKFKNLDPVLIEAIIKGYTEIFKK